MRFSPRSLTVILSLYTLTAMFISSMSYTETLAHIPPSEREDISFLALRRTALFNDEEYALIFRQTGLGRGAVNSILPFELPKYQQMYFSVPEYKCEATTPVSFEEYVPDPEIKIASVQDGDILYTRASHILSWRNGHTAIVTDAQSRRTLEAVVIGSDTAFQSLSKWERYPNFKILRLKDVPFETRQAIAKTAEKHLACKPYNLLAGIIPLKYCPPEDVSGTQCAHLVWLACAEYGYDIDSDGGAIVTPTDILNSELLEVVQSYG